MVAVAPGLRLACGASCVKRRKANNSPSTLPNSRYSRLISPCGRPASLRSWLPAARLYPLVQFAYQGKPNEFKPLTYLRVDYRFAFTIEAGLALKSTRPQDVDHAAVFLDIDVEPSAWAGIKGVTTLSGIDLVFAAAEKPLPREMIGQGILHGNKAQWDNIHVWGAQSPLPATPGAFHAAHFHWRWGTLAAYPSGFPFYSKGGSQFSGIGGAGGPLLDPRVPFQNLRFAITGDVTKQTAGPWKASANGSTRTFDDLFTNESPTPADISNGAHIVVWVSVELFRDFPRCVVMPGPSCIPICRSCRMTSCQLAHSGPTST